MSLLIADIGTRGSLKPIVAELLCREKYLFATTSNEYMKPTLEGSGSPTGAAGGAAAGVIFSFAVDQGVTRRA
jgi:hypothetical protein